MESQWPTHVAHQITESIRTDVQVMIGTSKLVRQPHYIALVERQDIQLGRLLGKGAFSQVHEVRLGEGRRVAIKFLQKRLLSQPDDFRLAAAELAVEAHMLASFDHPNIIKIRGWAARGIQSFSQGRHDSFFLLLDCLDETLDQRIERWEQQTMSIQRAVSRSQQHGIMDFWNRMQPRNDQMAAELHMFNVTHQEELYLEKLRICGEIASALAYIHKKRVIYRDLKPTNLGFLLNGRVQIFDFGLSRELPTPSLDEPFHMSGKVGTLRYMAVEVACNQPYNVSADVYSWAMVSYEIMTLVKPFSGWTRDMHSQMVCCQGARPSLSGSIVPPFQAILRQAWHQMPHMRPSMEAVHHEVQLLQHQQMQLVLELMKSHQFQPLINMPDDLIHRRAPARHSSSCTDSTALTSESWEQSL